MSPLTSISGALPVQSFLSGADAASAPTKPVPGLDSISPAGKPTEILPAPSVSGTFGSLLGHFVEEVNARQNAAAEAVSSLQTGGNVSLHQAVIAMEEASVSFQLMVEVRNKLLDSYQELMRMQI